MRTTDRAHSSALPLVAAVTATVAAGAAALARTGAALCGHRVLAHHHDAAAMATGSAMTMPVAAPVDGVCPILFYAAGLAASLCLAAVLLLAARPVARALAAAFRLLVPGADSPWVVARDVVLVPSRVRLVRLVRRRPSRAPPVLR
jgi:hypothetical protein